MASPVKHSLQLRQNNLLKRKEELEKEIDKLTRFINKNLFNNTDKKFAISTIQRHHNEIDSIDKRLSEIGVKLLAL